MMPLGFAAMAGTGRFSFRKEGNLMADQGLLPANFDLAHASPPPKAIRLSKERNTSTMLSWAITFLIIAIIAAILGFGGVAGTAVGIAKILFFVFLVLFVVSLLMGRRSPPV
jgi:uncharacterized membrane protein YtjA (UPF0391 family)